MKFTKMVCATAVVFAALGGTASAAPGDVSVMGPYIADSAGLQECQTDGAAYQQEHGKQTSCRLEADGNQYFLWASV